MEVVWKWREGGLFSYVYNFFYFYFQKNVNCLGLSPATYVFDTSLSHIFSN